MRRVIGLILIGLGAAFLVLAPMVKFYAVPKLSVAPLDLDPSDTSNSSGTVATVVDLATGTEKSNVELNSIRRTKADVAASQQAGNNIGVYDSLSVISLASDSSGQPYLPADPERYAFDRTTTVMVATAGANVGGVPITEAMIGTDTIMPLKFPFRLGEEDLQRLRLVDHEGRSDRLRRRRGGRGAQHLQVRAEDPRHRDRQPGRRGDHVPERHVLLGRAAHRPGRQRLQRREDSG